MGIAARALLVVVGPRPPREANRLVSEFVESLLHEFGTRQAVMHPHALAAAFGDRRNARVCLKLGGGIPTGPDGPERRRHARRADVAGAREAAEDLLCVIAGEGLVRVSLDGSRPSRLEVPSGKAGETGARFPFFLPDGRRFLLFIGGETENGIHLASLDSADRRVIVDDVLSAPLLAPTPGGPTYLLYLQDEALVAQEFDQAAGRVRAMPRVVVDGIGRVATPALMPTAGVSPSGTLAFQTGGDFTTEKLTWMSRVGLETGVLSLGMVAVNPAMSPDGRFVAFQGNSGGDVDLWVTDVSRAVTSRLTRGGGPDRNPIWSPDGKQIAFLRAGTIYVKNADGSGTETVLVGVGGTPRGWSPDGHYLLYERRQRLYLWHLATGRAPIPVGPRDSSARDGRLSPDGRFVAYTSDISGREEIYVEALLPAAGRVQVSASGGTLPRWNRSKPELFFVGPQRRLMAVGQILRTTPTS
jgi:eukaryotic-like serine/threonine-protein kinase